MGAPSWKWAPSNSTPPQTQAAGQEFCSSQLTFHVSRCSIAPGRRRDPSANVRPSAFGFRPSFGFRVSEFGSSLRRPGDRAGEYQAAPVTGRTPHWRSYSPLFTRLRTVKPAFLASEIERFLGELKMDHTLRTGFLQAGHLVRGVADSGRCKVNFPPHTTQPPSQSSYSYNGITVSL